MHRVPNDVIPAETRFRPTPPMVLGLMGGIAAGKSAVAGAMARRGLVHVDADRIAHAVLAAPETIAAIVAEFGPEVLSQAGEIDRKIVARIVFDDPALRLKLENLTHPPIRRAILEAVDEARTRGESCLLDVPLLLENGLIDHCDKTVFVDTTEPVRRMRAAMRGWADDELARREAAQAPLAAKRAAADFTIQNDGSLDETQRQVDDLLRRLTADQ